MIKETKDFLDTLTKSDISILMYYICTETAKLKGIASVENLDLDNDDDLEKAMRIYHKRKTTERLCTLL